jgi:hypothetical protein
MNFIELYKTDIRKKLLLYLTIGDVLLLKYTCKELDELQKIQRCCIFFAASEKNNNFVVTFS